MCLCATSSEGKMYAPWTLITALLATILTTESVRILGFFQIPSASHHFVFRAVLEGLAQRGHEVVYVTSYPYDKPPQGITQITIKNLDYEDEFGMDFFKIGELSYFGKVKYLLEFGTVIAESSLSTKEVQELIHSDQKFDAVLFEPYFGQEYLSALIHKFDAIGIDLVTLGEYSWLNELAGLPDNPAYQVTFISQATNANFWQRLYNTYVTAITSIGGYYYMSHFQYMADKYFNYTGWETRPPIEVLVRNKSLILVNMNHVLGPPIPLPPHRKNVGGLNIKPNKPLPKDLLTLMDESKEGVIYMSLGTHLKTSKILKEIADFFSVFRQLPQKVLLKLESAEYPGDIPPNVRIEKWFPQQDILAHNNCVLFISHGGLLSMTESVYYGVPLVGIPIFADQPKNIIFAESAGFGRMLRRQNITRETVSWTVREVLYNKRYKEEAVRRSKMLRDQRHSPVEEAVYWIEHTLKYPFASTPKSASLSAIQLYLIDIKLFIVSVLLVIIYSIYVIICFIMKKFSKQSEKIKMH